MASSLKINDSLFLVRADVPTSKPITVDTPVNHLFICDTSGSMAYDLPKMRQQIVSKLPELLKDGDTFTAMWFSGRKEVGMVVEYESIVTMKDLKRVKALLDKNLVPKGLTGFKDPLDKVKSVVAALPKENRGNPWALTFLSDGCDNQWSCDEVLTAAKSAGALVESTTFIEYGFYADRPLLAQMAEKAGGSLIFAKDFDAWLPVFEKSIEKRVKVGKRIRSGVESDLVGGFAFAAHEGDLLTFELLRAEGVTGKHYVNVPEGVTEFAYLSHVPIGQVLDMIEQPNRLTTAQAGLVAHAYAALSLFATRMKPDVVLPLLSKLGDVRLIEQFSGCFGKQRYADFQAEAQKAAFDSSARWTTGFDTTRVPKDDAFTILDLFKILQEDETAMLLLDHEAFKYARIGRARVDPNEEDGTALHFETNPWALGYPIQNLVWNESRPNLSVLVKKEGHVALPKHRSAKLPDRLETFIFRAYTMVKDGIVHVDKLPVRMSTATRKRLDGLLPIDDADGAFAILDLSKLPVMNRQMVKELSAHELFQKHFDLTEVQAAQKVFKGFAAELLPKEAKSASFKVLYGEDGAKWLESLGITDYSGFNPKKVIAAPSGDFYMDKELNVKLKGLSSLPSLKEALAARKAGKPETISRAVMRPAIERVEEFLASSIYTKASAKDEVLKTWVQTETKALDKRRRALLQDVAKAAFTTVVGQVWFKEFKTLLENSLEIDAKPFQDKPLVCTAEMEEKRVDL